MVNKQFKQNFTEIQNREILKSKGYMERNLLHLAAVSSKNIKIFQILCENCSNLDIFKDLDVNNMRIFLLAVQFATSEIFDFLIQQLDKVESQTEIKKILNNWNIKNLNLLQLAAKDNKNLELHKSLWTTIRKYFSSNEIAAMAKCQDVNSFNILQACC